jgi:hypothetical protein
VADLNNDGAFTLSKAYSGDYQLNFTFSPAI